MASNLRVDTILPSTGTSLGIGTANGSITVNGSVNSLNVSGNLGVGGVLTYEDVTNVDSVGVITARNGGYLDIRTGSSINTNATGSAASGTIHKNTNSGEFAVVSGGTGGNNHLTFYTSASAAPTEKLRIGPAGQLGIGGANYGTSGQFLQSQGSGSPVQWASVSSDLQFAQWRVNTGWSGAADPIVNWTETSDKNVTLTESSGIFSFPSTGYWHIMCQLFGYKNDDQDNIELHIMRTVNNSNYHTKSWAYSHMNNDDGGNLYTSVHAELIFDVTSTTNCKIKFKTINNTVNWHADSSRNDSYAIFKRLAAT